MNIVHGPSVPPVSVCQMLRDGLADPSVTTPVPRCQTVAPGVAPTNSTHLASSVAHHVDQNLLFPSIELQMEGN